VNNNKRIFLFCCLLLLLVTSVHAFTVIPARELVDYTVPFTHQSSFTVRIPDGSQSFSVTATGPLASYVSLPVTDFTTSEGFSETPVKYAVSIPHGVLEPGDHDITFSVQQELSPLAQGKSVLTTINIITSLRITVPYPGEHATITISVHEGDTRENVLFVVPIYNSGSESLHNPVVHLTLVDDANTILTDFTETLHTIPPKTMGKARFTWPEAAAPGVYTAQATVTTDETTASTETSFTVGKPKITIKDLVVKDFTLGETVALTIPVQSLWNEQFSSVQAHITFSDSQGTVVSVIQTPSITLGARKKGTLLSYWDTTSLKEGTYTANILLQYDSKSFERTAAMTVNNKQFRATVNQPPQTAKETTRILTILGILIIVNILWFLHFHKRRI